MKDISASQKLIEKRLQRREREMRGKLPFTLDQTIDMSHFSLKDILDLPQLKSMLDNFYEISGVGVCIKDEQGKTLLYSTWQKVCSHFHRAHPLSAVHCEESNEVLSEEIPFGTHKAFKCANGLWDLSTPIIVEDQRLGKLNIGQFLYDDEEVDESVVRQRAHMYGYDEEAYLEAYGNVPRWSHDKIQKAMDFCIQLTNMISTQGYANLRMAKMLDEHKKLEEILKQEKVKAEAANEAKTQFLANMSHELRTPLNGIMGMNQLLSMTELNKEQQEYMDISLKACANLTGVVNEILDYTSLAKKPEELVETEFQPEMLLLETMGLYQAAADEKKINLSYSISPEVPDEVMGDRFKIKQILNNLVGNAVKFTEKGNVLMKITTMPSNDSDNDTMLKFIVQDTGIGIEPERLSSVFDTFTQVDSSHTRKYGGLGLGLSIARELAWIMEGDITVESTPAVGSTFNFTCKAKLNKSERTHDRIKVDAGTVVMSRPQRVLVVDDDYANRWMTQTMLKKEGLLVDTAENGQSAIDQVKMKKYDVIFMDLQMPVMHGYEATRSIRNLDKHGGATVPIIAMTAAGLPEVRKQCMDMGMNDYLLKPIDRETLLKKINEVKNLS